MFFVVQVVLFLTLKASHLKSHLKSNEIILSRQTKLLGSYLKMWSWDSNKKRSASPSIKRTQFSLILAWPSTVHKVQSLSLEQGVTDFDLWKQMSFGSGQIYTTLTRLRTYDNLYCIREFQKSAIKVNKDTLLEYERLKQIKRKNISDNTISLYSKCTILFKTYRWYS